MICKNCGEKRKQHEMMKHSRTGLPTEVCMACVVEKRAATRLTNSPHPPLMDVRAETNLHSQIAQLERNFASLGKVVTNMLVEQGKSGLELIVQFVQTGEQHIAI